MPMCGCTMSCSSCFQTTLISPKAVRQACENCCVIGLCLFVKVSKKISDDYRYLPLLSPTFLADSVTPSALCSEHCKLARLLQVCPQNLLRRLEGEMGETGVSFLEPVCELEGEQCLTLRTSLSAGASAVTVGMETQVGESLH